MKNIYRFLLLFLILPFFFAGFSSAEKKIHRPLNLVFNDQIYKLNFEVNPNLISRIPHNYLIIGEKKIPLDLNKNIPQEDNLIKIETTFSEEISYEYLKKLFDEIFNIDSRKNNLVKITIDENEKINFLGNPQSGYDIEFNKFYHLVNEAFLQNIRYVRIPAKKKFSNVFVYNKELRKQGIKEIIAIGESNFEGSSWARRKNISVAAALYNGIIIPQGKIFSFNEILKDVSEKSGFAKELVIKGNKTEKEYGGGVCQVSTTIFRAAFLGGLDIRRRRSHSYAVPYYKPHGLDATIYLDVQDFKFKNDTTGDILIQTIIDKNTIKFVFYGTRDDRTVEIEGPFISDYKKAPAPIIEKTDKIPVGEKYIASYAHDGFFARWKRIVKRSDGSFKEKVLNSNYKPWPARILEGVVSEKLSKK
jgi:vancomycin resistance protein YoaR